MTLMLILLLGCIGLILLGAAGLFKANRNDHSTIRGALFMIVLGLAGTYFITTTGTFEFGLRKTQAWARHGSWLITDNSGGQCLRHWVIRNSYVESSQQSDGWQFTDEDGNLCYVSGDAFVMRINEDLDEFLKDYRVKYAIPTEQPALQ